MLNWIRWNMTFRERLEWLLRMGLLVFVLAAAAFLSAVMTMRFAIHGREVEMPNLVGKSSADAQAILGSRGLQLKIVNRIYSEFPANAVARQSPPAGEHMKVSQDAHAVLSLGPQNVTIPAVVGESLRVARIQLLQSGLQLGEVTSYPAPDCCADTVLQQSPPVGNARRESSRGFACGRERNSSCLRHALVRRHATARRGPADFLGGTETAQDHLRSVPAMAQRRRHSADTRSGLEGYRRNFD